MDSFVLRTTLNTDVVNKSRMSWASALFWPEAGARGAELRGPGLALGGRYRYMKANNPSL